MNFNIIKNRSYGFTTRLLESQTFRKLSKNVFALSLSQWLNYLLPLVTFPYLVRILGPNKFGLLALATGVIQYFVVLTDYGFNFSATQQVSFHRHSKEKLGEIVSGVITVRLIFLVLSLLLLTIFCVAIPFFRNDWELFVLTFGLVIGNVLTPMWFFQGVEKMRYITIVNLLIKTLFTASIFLFVKNEADYLLVPLLNSAAYVVAGILALSIVTIKFEVVFRFAPLKVIQEQMINGFYIFVAILASTIYTLGPTVILGAVSDMTSVGNYAAGMKIVWIIHSITLPFLQSTYPHMSILMREGIAKVLEFSRRILQLVAVATILGGLIVLFLADLIVDLMLGPSFETSAIIIRITAFLPGIIALSNISGIQMMSNLGMKERFAHIEIIVGLSSIVVTIVLCMWLAEYGAAVASLFAEAFVLALTLFSLRKVWVQGSSIGSTSVKG